MTTVSVIYLGSSIEITLKIITKTQQILYLLAVSKFVCSIVVIRSSQKNWNGLQTNIGDVLGA